MHATIILYGRWPLVRAQNPHHPIFETHEMLTDLVVSDMQPMHALRDTMADGAVVSVPIKTGALVEIIKWTNSDSPIIDAITDLASGTTVCESHTELVEAIKKPFSELDTIRIVIVPEGPCKEVTSDVMDQKRLAASATVVQSLSITHALDMTLEFRNACPKDSVFYAVAFGTSRFRANGWEACPMTVAFAPIGEITLSAVTNVSTVPTAILSQLPGLDASDRELQHHEGAAITIDTTNEDMWSCTCRVFHENERYEVIRYFQAYTIEQLPRYFLRLTNGVDWHIRDSAGAVDNLADDPDWCMTPTAVNLIAACMPAVRDLARRRSPAVEAFLEAAEEAAASESFSPAPDEPLLAPEEVPTVSAEPPPSQTPAITWKESVLAKVSTVYSVSDAEIVRNFLKSVEEITPKTLLLPGDGSIEVIEGAFPPSTLQHMLQRTRSASLLTFSGSATKIHISSEKLRIGRVKVDLESFLHCERLVFYRGRSNDRSSRRSASSYASRPQRGSVQRFVRRIELAKALMRR